MTNTARLLIQAGLTALEDRRRSALNLTELGTSTYALTSLGSAVPTLRSELRRQADELDPVEEAIVLTKALRTAGIPVQLVIGRELAPASKPATFTAWVDLDGECLTTGSPVLERFEPILRLPM